MLLPDRSIEASETKAVETVLSVIFGPGVNSQNRLWTMLYETIRKPPAVFWPVFLEGWPRCDCIWPYKAVALEVLRLNHLKEPSRKYMGTQDAAFFDAVPHAVPVYRGCARYRTRGLSWTTDQDRAAWFAKGSRFDAEPDRVLASAIIPKEHIFSVHLDRNESEIVLDPRRLRRLTVTGIAEL